MKPLLCLDLEGTLISNAVSQIPRPGLYRFLERAAEICDLMIYSSVSAERVDSIRDLLVSEKYAPEWFLNLPIIRPDHTIKPKSACGRINAYLLDDQPGVIAPGENDWWIPISEYVPPYSESDTALTNALESIKVRVRLLEPSIRVDLVDL
jgi:hypothetical protein